MNGRTSTTVSAHSGLLTEADVLRTIAEGTYTLRELYKECLTRADVARANGLQPPDEDHPTDQVWRRRLRSALQASRVNGNAKRIGRSVWAIQGTRERPRQLILIAPGGTCADIELRIQDAVALLGSLDEPVDLVLCDPPYALERGRSASSLRRTYRRDHGKVIGGYVDVPVEEYEQFTHAWVGAAAAALRPGGQLAAITGPQQAAIVQCAGAACGLTWVSSIAARREFALYTTRRPACAHWTITVMCSERLHSPRRVFNPPRDLPKARSGGDYPLDWWEENGRSDRPGLLRYDNSLPRRMVRRIIEALTNRRELVIDPCVGGGTSAIEARSLGRRFIGGDVNPDAVRFTAARLLSEHAWREEVEPSLFPARLVA